MLETWQSGKCDGLLNRSCCFATTIGSNPIVSGCYVSRLVGVFASPQWTNKLNSGMAEVSVVELVETADF